MSDQAGLASSRGRVLVADDADAVRSLFHRLLVADGHDVILAADGPAALEAVSAHQPDVVLLDITMPGLTGLEVCQRLKADPATRLTPVVLITGKAALADRISGLDAGADEFLSKPVHPLELRARVRSLARMKQLVNALDSAESAFISLALTLEARDPYTKGHCERIARFGVALGRAMGLPQEDIEALHKGGYLHDIGKVGVPDAVLLKPARLTAEEFDLMKRHPEIGDALCAPLQSLRRVRPIVRSHHERLDGSGYPDGLQGENIPLLAQIVGVVDVFDALTSTRPYRRSLTVEETLAHLREEARAGKFDPTLVDAFAETRLSHDDVPGAFQR